MRAWLYGGASVLCLAGCGWSKPPLAKLTPAIPTAPSESVRWPAAALATPNSHGRSVADWGSTLRSNDQVERQQAARALASMGDVGIARLLTEMPALSMDAQLQCLEVIPRAELVSRSRQSLPLLFAMLRQDNPFLRQQAALRLPWFTVERARIANNLKELAEHDPNPEVRAAAQDALAALQPRNLGP